ncbi:MAG: c-type cytochrome [Deltaproteobacteria bacterium]|nr:c-type cytochrome [Deltaproteobacteria bacterium]MBW2363344.1 c-type cytochrome [Deltaproteobacteria bacterium]
MPEKDRETARQPDPEAGKQFLESIEGGNCKTCHYTSKLRMVGPGMESVTKRHTDEWLRMWLTDPQGTWRSDHPETEELKTRTRKAKAPVTSCVKKPMTQWQVDDLISFLETLEKE